MKGKQKEIYECVMIPPKKKRLKSYKWTLPGKFEYIENFSGPIKK